MQHVILAKTPDTSMNIHAEASDGKTPVGDNSTNSFNTAHESATSASKPSSASKTASPKHTVGKLSVTKHGLKKI